MAVVLKDKLELDKFDISTYTNVGVIETKKLDEKMKLNTSLIDGYIIVIKDNTQIEEVEDGAIDSADNIGKFCCGSDGKLKLIVDKATINTIEKAKSELVKYQAIVQLEDDLTYETDMFDVTMINMGDKKPVFNTVILSGEKTLGYMKNNIDTIDLNTTNPIEFRIVPKLK